MPLPNKEKYEQRKIDNLIQYLNLYHQKGQPIDYEILVDGFKAVRRTSDPDMFSMFENFVTADTRSIEVLLFTGSSNNNEKRIFYFGEVPKEREKEEGLSGVDVRSMVDEEVKKKLQAREYESLREENSNLKKHIADLEGEVEELEKYNARLEATRSPLNSFLGDIGSNLVESFIKRNPKLMSSIPGGEALAGLLQQENTEAHGESVSESEVSFKPKGTSSSLSGEESSTAKTLTEEEQAAIGFVHQLKENFTREEFDQVLLILQTLANDKTKISLIINHVNIMSAKASA
jgi:hypothetical protein